MVFSSALFTLYFLPFFLVLYFVCPRMVRNYFILLASLLFYAWGAPQFVFILLGSTVIDFYLVKALDNAKDERMRKRWLITSIVMNVGLLLYFKYANFFVDNFNAALAGMGFEEVSWTKVALPIGISFYTFQTLTYSVDVYRRTSKALNHLGDYLLYITLFPQMIAGPIVRYGVIADQIRNREENWDKRFNGLCRFAIGLGKKVLIANTLGVYASDMMGATVHMVDSASLWLGVLAYGLQIYFDFSGYSDIAIGIGKMLGFDFPENFNNPYVSRSITEFWRRWHITLGSWMRDYLYIPLGGSKTSSKGRLYFNLWVVFLISGLWHGASWNFVWWGVFHGTFLVVERLFLGKYIEKIPKLFGIVYTFVLVMISWAIFAVEEPLQLELMLKNMFGLMVGGEFAVPPPGFYPLLAVAAFFSFFVLFPGGKAIQDRIYAGEVKPVSSVILGVISLALITLSLAYITSSDFNPFIYFRF